MKANKSIFQLKKYFVVILSLFLTCCKNEVSQPSTPVSSAAISVTTAPSSSSTILSVDTAPSLSGSASASASGVPSGALTSPTSSIKSVYIANHFNFQKTLKILKKYGANAVVIDVKDDQGRLLSGLPVTFNEKNKFVRSRSFKTFLKKLKEKNIYTIARVVALKEFVREDLCVKNEDGSIKIDKEKMSWMDPSDEKVQQYLEDVCTSAIKIGFDEVQLDYVRFSSYFRLAENKNDDKNSNNAANRSRIDAINKLIERISDSVHKLGGKVSVCVFGCTIEGSVDTPSKKNQTLKSAEILGQDYIEITERADYICPMIYPSHYPQRTPSGMKDPDLHPYETIKICMQLSNHMFENVEKIGLKARVRPYLQAFTARWLKNHLQYTETEIKEQIKAVQDSGAADQWGLFDMSGKYSEP